MTDKVQKEFSREILSLQTALGFAGRPAEYAGMLLGVRVLKVPNGKEST